jgi:hypothetical protein
MGIENIIVGFLSSLHTNDALAEASAL